MYITGIIICHLKSAYAFMQKHVHPGPCIPARQLLLLLTMPRAQGRLYRSEGGPFHCLYQQWVT
jgi:hypothetical protein